MNTLFLMIIMIAVIWLVFTEEILTILRDLFLWIWRKLEQRVAKAEGRQPRRFPPHQSR